jgi:hypothetical protein
MAGDIQMPGTIGGSNPGLAEMILESESEIMRIGYELRGWKCKIADGKLFYEEPEGWDADDYHTERCVIWFQGKLRSVMGKNTYLANLTSDNEMNETIWYVYEEFITELLCKHREYELDDKKYIQLAFLYLDYIDMAFRHPLGGGIRKFLTSTVAEQHSRSESKMTEQSEKKGPLSFLRR